MTRNESSPALVKGGFGPWAELGPDNRLIALSMFLWGTAEGLWLYIYPLYVKSLGATPQEIGFVISISLIGMSLPFIPAGLLADWYSRKKIILSGYFLAILGMILIALAPDWRALVPGFLLYYLSSFGLPAMNSYMVHASEGRDLNRVFTLVYASYTAGIIFSPALGGWLGERFGMRLDFFISECLIILATLALLPLREQPAAGRAKTQNLRPLLSHRPFWSFSLATAFIFLVAHVGWPLVPNFLQEVRGLDLSLIGALATAQSLGATVLAVLLGRISRGAGGLVASQLLLGLSSALLLGWPSPWAVAGAFFLRGSIYAVGSLSSAQVGKALDSRSMGLGFGVFATLRSLAMVPGPYITGYLYAMRPSLPFLLSLAFLPLSILLTIVTFRGLNGLDRRAAPEIGSDNP